MKRILITLSITVALLAIVATTGFALYLRNNACTAERYRSATVPILREWRSAESAAEFSSADDLPNRISDLKDIRRRFVAVDYPSCAYRIHGEMSDSLDQYIAGYEARAAGEPSTVADNHFDQAETHLNNAATMLSAIDN